MKNILGIANDETASACLVQDGKLIAAASEERFSRIKMDNSWPSQSITYCLQEGGIDLKEVDAIVYGWSAGFDGEKHLLPYFDRIVVEAKNNPEGLEIFRERIATEIEQDRAKRDEFSEYVQANGLGEKAFSIDHHEAHAYSAYCCSSFQEALVVTCDGRGDFLSITVSKFNPEKMEVLYRGSSSDSLGFFYGRVTALLGFTPHRHEGKVTGLAAHGNPETLLPVMQEMIQVKDGQVYGCSGQLYRPFYSNYDEKFTQIIDSNSREDVAAAAQAHLENCITELVTHYVNETSAKYVCMAGGVFANVRVNQCVFEIPGVINIYVHPQMGDGGLCVGAAAGYLFQRGVSKVEAANMYLGPEYSSSEIEETLNQFPEIRYDKSSDIVEQVVESINNDLVVGWFQGRMEFGPRALCNRSILYHCRDKTANDWLNERMERTEFMPFAPVSTDDWAPQCYVGWQPDHIASRFMTVTYNCHEEMVRKCPAAVHIDGTARPQIVNHHNNPLMYKLLGRYYEKTSEPALINTSFNRHEEPIVRQPSEAIEALVSGMIDVLVIGNYIATKSNNN